MRVLLLLLALTLAQSDEFDVVTPEDVADVSLPATPLPQELAQPEVVSKPSAAAPSTLPSPPPPPPSSTSSWLSVWNFVGFFSVVYAILKMYGERLNKSVATDCEVSIQPTLKANFSRPFDMEGVVPKGDLPTHPKNSFYSSYPGEYTATHSGREGTPGGMVTRLSSALRDPFSMTLVALPFYASIDKLTLEIRLDPKSVKLFFLALLAKDVPAPARRDFKTLGEPLTNVEGGFRVFGDHVDVLPALKEACPEFAAALSDPVLSASLLSVICSDAPSEEAATTAAAATGDVAEGEGVSRPPPPASLTIELRCPPPSRFGTTNSNPRAWRESVVPWVGVGLALGDALSKVKLSSAAAIAVTVKRNKIATEVARAKAEEEKRARELEKKKKLMTMSEGQ
jgi:hypothetical protein